MKQNRGNALLVVLLALFGQEGRLVGASVLELLGLREWVQDIREIEKREEKRQPMIAIRAHERIGCTAMRSPYLKVHGVLGAQRP